MSRGMSGHQSTKYKTVEWLTPPDLIQSLGIFDLDPCSPVDRPWDTAKWHYTINQDGLSQPWYGRVWCNPPYDRAEQEKFLLKMARHGNGVALIFARTETKQFFECVWGKADAILFIKGRLRFYRRDGSAARANAGAPSCLIAYGQQNVKALKESGIQGALVDLSTVSIVTSQPKGFF